MRILIIDDDSTVCTSLKLLLGKVGHEVKAITNPIIAIDQIKEFKPNLIVLDMNFSIATSGKQGLKLLKNIFEYDKSISVILMTGWATVALAVEGMKLGAKDFIAKPWDNKELINSIKNIEALFHSSNHKINQEHGVNSIIGNSKSIEKVLAMIDKVAPTDASILISGESGTGKELIAEAIHQKSNRKDKPFIKVNLGGLPIELFESEMFGHVKGAFTGADIDREGRFSIANGGTIFLDEIGELPLANQVKLLRVLQEKTFEKLGSSKQQKIDVRVICATNRNLFEMVNEGTFREDLLYRINLINIHIPPLRDRKEDIPLIANYFLKNIAALYNKERIYITDECLNWLSNQEFKGNIRQLKNIIERTFFLHQEKKALDRKSFLPSFSTNQVPDKSKETFNLEAMELETIKKALAINNNVISTTAKALGITRSALYRRLEKYKINHES